MSSPSLPCKGDYVLATKWGDGDPNDQWCVGFFDREDDGRFYVVDNAGNQFRATGFRRVKKISQRRGEFILRNKEQVISHNRSLWWWARCSMIAYDELRPALERCVVFFYEYDGDIDAATALLLVKVRRDKHGRVTRGWVVNGEWWLHLDYDNETMTACSEKPGPGVERSWKSSPQKMVEVFIPKDRKDLKPSYCNYNQVIAWAQKEWKNEN